MNPRGSGNHRLARYVEKLIASTPFDGLMMSRVLQTHPELLEEPVVVLLARCEAARKLS